MKGRHQGEESGGPFGQIAPSQEKGEERRAPI